MTFEIIFIASGILIIILLLAKIRELKKEKPFLLRLISQGDERARAVGHWSAHLYTDGKERATFFFQKQLPMRTRQVINRSETFIQEQTEILVGNIRNSRLLKKDAGISEFFKSISDKEKGEIHEEFGDSQSATNEVE